MIIFTYKEYMLCKKFCGDESNIPTKLEEESETYNLEVKWDTSKITQKHDKTFKMIFSDKEEVAKFLNETLKPKEKIEAEELEKYKSSFITSTFRNQEADIVYKMKNRQIFFLIEHQSKVDYHMPFRILRYQMEIMESALDYSKIHTKNYELPNVIPIVLYTGKQKWNVAKEIEEKQAKLEGVETRLSYASVVDMVLR